jgi:hypothetical protein
MQQHFYYNAISVPSAKDIFASEARHKMRVVPPQIEINEMMEDIGEEVKDMIELQENQR